VFKQGIISQRCYGESNLQFFHRIYGSLLLDLAMHGRYEAYAAMGVPGRVYASVISLRVVKRQPNFDVIEFDMVPESSLPILANCPKRIFGQLTPLDDLYDQGTMPYKNASSWRKKVIRTMKFSGTTIPFKEQPDVPPIHIRSLVLSK